MRAIQYVQSLEARSLPGGRLYNVSPPGQWTRDTGSARWPAHKSAAQEVPVDMVDGLSPIVAMVEHGAEPCVRQPQDVRCLLHGQQRSPQQTLIADVHQGRVVSLRDQQHM